MSLQCLPREGLGRDPAKVPVSLEESTTKNKRSLGWDTEDAQGQPQEAPGLYPAPPLRTGGGGAEAQP